MKNKVVDLAGLRTASEHLTGRKYRLEIGAAIHLHAGDSFTIASIESITGVRYPRVSEDLRRLKDAELIRGIASGSGDTEMKAVPHAYWKFCHNTAALFGWAPR
jgi:DNA-binding transcriptional ArsR family regulator